MMWKTLLVVLILLVAPARVFGADYEITLGAIYTETEAPFHTLLYASCPDENGTKHDANVTFSINAIPFTWNTYTERYEGSDSSATPAIKTYNAITASADSENITSTFSLNNTVTVTWTEGTMSRLQTDFMTGDFIGSIINENTRVMGVLFTYTALLAILSVGIYNVSGVYATVFVWVMGWSVWSGVTHGGAQLLGILFILLGLGVALTKMYMGRRNT